MAGTKKTGDSHTAKALWTMKAAKDRDDEFYDSFHQKYIQGRPQTRLELWEELLKSLVAALAKALEYLEGVYECLKIRSQVTCPSPWSV